MSAPDGLSDRVVLARGMRRRNRPVLWATAASLVLAVALAGLLPPSLAGNALADEAIEHVREEPQSFRLISLHEPGFLAGELAAQGIRLGAALGEVTYTQLGPMREGRARHIIVATASGPVTLRLMPSDPTSRRRTQSDKACLSAIALPAARGSIAIVAASRAQALEVERLLVLS